MTPQIALDLSLDGIVLLSRAPEGGWWREGVVRLDAPDMDAQMKRLQARAAARAGADFLSILILPDSQLLYTSLERDDRKPRDTIRALLKGRTPYAVEDLAFDWIEQGARLQVAVAALETLMEAESFASEYGFRPVAIVANPQDPLYPGIPDFGRTGIAPGLLDGAPLEMGLEDGFRISPAPPLPEPEPEQEAAPEAQAEPEDEPGASQTAAIAAELAEAVPTEPQQEATEPPTSLGAPDPDKVAPGAPDEQGADTDLRTTAAETAPDAAAADPAGAEPEPLVSEDSEGAAEAPADTTAKSKRAGKGQKGKRPVIARPATKADGAAAAAPVFAHRDKPAKDPVPEPAFSTRRSGTAPMPDLPDPAGRIAPRLSAPTPKAPASDDAAPRSDQATVVPETASGESEAAPASQAVASGLAATVAAGGSVAARISALRASLPAPRAKDPDPAEQERQEEAAALALPGLQREKAAAPKKSRPVGLYLTLGLLAALLLIGLFAGLTGPDENVAEEGRTPAVIAASPAEALPRAPLPSAGSDATPIVAAADPAADPLPPREDLAALLPGAPGAASPLPDLVTPPDPVPAATPEELAEDEMPEIAAVLDADEPAPDAVTLEVFAAEGTFTGTPSPAAPDGVAEPEIYLASIDPVVPEADAVALPPAAPPADGFSPQTVPAPPGTRFETGDDGLVVATPEGTLAPGGYTVIAGRPDTMPRPRPSEQAEASQAEERDAADAALRRTQPRPRPEDAAERIERQRFGGLTREEITRTRPSQRPASITEAGLALEARRTEDTAAAQAAIDAAAASLAARADDVVVEPDGPVSELALSASDRPRTRPRAVEREAASIVTQRRERASAAATPPARQAGGSQTIRSPGGSVARAATDRNVIRLNRINLIGVYGRPSARRALVRLSNGRYVKVEVGDRLDRGRVVAIGDAEVVYRKGNRNIALRLPNA